MATMTTMTKAAYAGTHGVSKAAAQKWDRQGHLVFQGSLVDVEASDAKLRAAGLGRFKALAQESKPAPAVNPKVYRREVNRPIENDAAEPAPSDGESIEDFLQSILEGRFKSKADAAAIKENALAAINLLEMREKDGALIALERAEAVFFAQARANRDAWMNWPTDIGPRMAAELGLSADRVTEVLTRHVHDHLSDLGEPDPDFAAPE